MDDRVGGAIEESGQNWIALVGTELMVGDCGGVQITMG